MNRTEHLAWCKERALAELDANGTQQAFASMASDLEKHDKTAGHLGIELGMMMLIGGHLDSDHEMRKFINGFN